MLNVPIGILADSLRSTLGLLWVGSLGPLPWRHSHTCGPTCVWSVPWNTFSGGGGAGGLGPPSPNYSSRRRLSFVCGAWPCIPDRWVRRSGTQPRRKLLRCLFGRRPREDRRAEKEAATGPVRSDLLTGLLRERESQAKALSLAWPVFTGPNWLPHVPLQRGLLPKEPSVHVSVAVYLGPGGPAVTGKDGAKSLSLSLSLSLHLSRCVLVFKCCVSLWLFFLLCPKRFFRPCLCTRLFHSRFVVVGVVVV